MPSPLTEYDPQWEIFEGEQCQCSGKTAPGILSETNEVELAAELLAVRDEQELDRFLGGLIRKVGSSLGRVVRPPIAQAIGGIIKGLVTTSLPVAGRALGTSGGGPLGSAIGKGLASVAGQALGMELEGLSHEDQEFEAARRFVLFAKAAVKNAASSPAHDPMTAAQAAVAAAAKRLAPGLLSRMGRAAANTNRIHSGRWIREGRNVIVMNCC